jgi:hypothetical protein
LLSFILAYNNRVCTGKVSFGYCAIPCFLALSADYLLTLHLATEGVLCCYFCKQLYHCREAVLGVVYVLIWATNKLFFGVATKHPSSLVLTDQSLALK